MSPNTLKNVSSFVLGGLMITTGYFHFHSPQPFISIVPKVMPYKRELVLISGFFEVLGGLGMLLPKSRKPAAIGLILLYLAVFPANINMAINRVPINGEQIAPWILWARLPLQAVLIAWAAWSADLKFAGKDNVAG